MVRILAMLGVMRVNKFIIKWLELLGTMIFSILSLGIGRQIHVRSHLLRFPYLSDMAIVLEKLVHLQLFCNPMDCSPPGLSVHVIFQARILEWVAIPLSRGSSGPRD